MSNIKSEQEIKVLIDKLKKDSQRQTKIMSNSDKWNKLQDYEQGNVIASFFRKQDYIEILNWVLGDE